jgi:hypothetical protein
MGTPILMAIAASAQLIAASGPNPSTTEPAPAPAAAAGSTHVGASGETEIFAPATTTADIRIDGRLSEAAWADAPLLTGFTQYEPVEGVPASTGTDVRVLVTDDAILFGIRAHETAGRGAIRATLARRDGFGSSDDWVRVILDTFNDQRRAFVFQVNPLGIQADGLWVEGRGGRGEPVDWSPDFLWSSVGLTDEHGYTVEVEIPFKSLRFPEAAVQDWGLQVTRRIQRSGYAQAWAPLTTNVANRLAQSGSLRGLEDLDPGRFVELNPVLTASRRGTWDEGVGGLVHGPSARDMGVNVTYGLTSNLTLDGTYNPDFSQVEADAGQITVNERFALFLPEKRPFFLEGTDVFSMPERLVYTRSIVNPVGAAKLSGKVGGTTIAYIGAVDEVSTADNPMVNLVRVRRDLGASSTVGAVYTDRTAPGQSFNRVAGADGRFVIARRYTVNVLAAASADGGGDASTRWGSLLSADFRRSSRTLSMSASFQDITPDFLARSGFIRQVGITSAEARTGYTWRGGQGALLERLSLSIDGESTWDRESFWAGQAPEEWDVGLRLSASLRGNIGGSLSYSRRHYDFSADGYEGLFQETDAGFAPFTPDQAFFQGLQSLRFWGWFSTWERVRGSFGASLSETPIFTAGLPADLAGRLSVDAELTLYPAGSVEVEVGARHVRLTRKRDGSSYSTATIPRLQGRYQFSRSMFVRGIAEYSSQERGDVLSPDSGQPLYSCADGACSPRQGSDRHDFRLEALAGYEPSPGTVLFLGYTRAMRDVEAFGFRDMQSRSDGLFVKLSYRFRM